MPLDQPFQKKSFADVAEALLADMAAGGGGRQPLTDVTEGSVVRTLAEAFARELAVCYEQLDHVYRNAYLETAEGGALDNVVALLGLKRRRGGFLEGSVQFSRGTPANEDIHIPAGTLVAGRGVPLCATVDSAVLARGELQVGVGVRAQEAFDGTVKAGQLAVMPRPIAGIETVHNPGDLLLRQREETDAELRQRAQGLVRAANTGTLSAMEEAARSVGINEVRIIEQPNGRPGEIAIILGDADIGDDVRDEARRRIEAVRPAGILFQCDRAETIYVQITATLETGGERSERERKAIEARLTQQLADYIGQLAIGDTVRATKIRAILASHDAVLGVEDTPGLALLTPYIKQANGSLASQVSRYVVENGDIAPGRTGRVVVDLEQLPPRLSLEPSVVNARLTVQLKADPAANRPGIENDLKQLVESINDAVGERRSARLDSKQLAITLKADKPELAKLIHHVRATVIHDRDGRAVELGDGNLPALQANVRGDDFGNRERLLLNPVQWVD
ncbi:baseplate J/gp47 family protein [Chitinolyticbacter meiyuanensis]|uniref:baseplate J/gp47 family protein n=1 Tax=Chitinolyticbacter meiyuanensis TaxID=682798 RepID=UPI0011E5AA6D|nr:baseplate J/gp47 family protein [Chitinolyticbacter meiyuanensis]